jgi:hypothetical protein
VWTERWDKVVAEEEEVLELLVEGVFSCLEEALEEGATVLPPGFDVVVDGNVGGMDDG